MRILIPKAKSEWKRWQRALSDRSGDPIWVDPWDIRCLPETPEMRSAWLNLDECQGVVCVSPTAARILTEALDQYWPMPPLGIHWMCNGPRTASVMHTAGLTVVHPTSDFTAEAVLALPETEVTTNDKWLIIKGQGGRTTLRETLESRGANVQELMVYQRQLDTEVLVNLPELAKQCQAIWLSSTFLAEQLLAQDSAFWRQWRGQWWVSSERLSQWCKAHQLTSVLQASGATPEALGELLTKQTGEL